MAQKKSRQASSETQTIKAKTQSSTSTVPRKPRWFEILQSIGIVSSILLSTYVIHQTSVSKRVDTLISITQSHRQIWTAILEKPELFRVLKPDPDLKAKPITDQERLIVVLLVLHLNAAYQAAKSDKIVPIENMTRDVTTLFSFPIVQSVWNDLRHFQNKDFAEFIESKFDPKRRIYKP